MVLPKKNFREDNKDETELASRCGALSWKQTSPRNAFGFVKSPQRCENATVSEWRGDKVGNLTDIKGQ
jgi:hypothetical protein